MKKFYAFFIASLVMLLSLTNAHATTYNIMSIGDSITSGSTYNNGG